MIVLYMHRSQMSRYLAYRLHGTRYTLYCIYTDLKCRDTFLMDYIVQDTHCIVYTQNSSVEVPCL